MACLVTKSVKLSPYSFARKLNFSILFLLLFLSVVPISAQQTIVVKPYLQNGGPNEMTVMWEVDGSGAGFVEWGLTPFDLINTVTSTAISSDGNKFIHTAKITNLQTQTKYYYRVKSNTQLLSTLYHFRTHPEKDSEESMNFVAMSDMQRDGSNPGVFKTIVEEGVIPIAESSYENGLEDLDAIIIPGDLVTNGTYSSWREDFFNLADSISPYVPLYPVLGNHEYQASGLPQYLKYMDLPLNGANSLLEQCWYKDLSNMRLIGLDSNTSSGDLATQLSWLETVLAEAATDETIDFVFVELHHPHRSELWTPGNNDWTGSVIEKLEEFTEASGKPSVHFYGHTHAYSRGHSRDHNHLMVNVATAGGAIDNWGEFPNADYEEHVKSQDEYGFVTLEVEAGADPKFVLKRYSQGDENNSLNNELRDEITIKRFDTAPQTPIGIEPFGEVNLACVRLKATDFANGANTHQASHWQIVEGCDFTTTEMVNIWKQSENWYNEVNTQANDDLTDETALSLESNTSYCWRVRYRNANLTWSDWSVPLSFNTINDLDQLTFNLLLNHDAELGLSNWIGDIESLTDNECNSVPAYEGQRFFAVGGVCANEQSNGLAYQTIDVSSQSVEIDNGNIVVQFSAFMRAYANNNDKPEMLIEYLDGNGIPIANSLSITNTTGVWLEKTAYSSVPINTRTLKVIVKGTRLTGADNDSYLDDLTVQLFLTDCSQCTIGESCDDGDACTANDSYDADCNCSGTFQDSDGDGICDADEGIVSFKIFLEGAYDLQTGMMSLYLYDENLIPLNQPYDIAPYNYTGPETLTTVPANMIDWVLVEVREGTPNLSGTRGTTTLETQAGVLLETGEIVDVNGLPLAFGNMVGGQSYYFCIRHRNHLDVLSSTAMSISANNFYDFTSSATQAFGTAQLKLMPDGKAAMFAADISQDGIIQTTDYDAWSTNPAILNTYIPQDANLDGAVQTTDYDVWFLNKAKIGSVEIGF